jgi:hypothetical protein
MFNTFLTILFKVQDKLSCGGQLLLAFLPLAGTKASRDEPLKDPNMRGLAGPMEAA